MNVNRLFTCMSHEAKNGSLAQEGLYWRNYIWQRKSAKEAILLEIRQEVKELRQVVIGRRYCRISDKEGVLGLLNIELLQLLIRMWELDSHT